MTNDIRVVLSEKDRHILAENVSVFLDKNGLTRQDFTTHGGAPLDQNIINQFIFNPKNIFPINRPTLERIALKMGVEVDQMLTKGGMEEVPREQVTMLDLTDAQRVHVANQLKAAVELGGKANSHLVRIVASYGLMDHIYNPEKPWRSSQVLLERLANLLKKSYENFLNGEEPVQTEEDTEMKAAPNHSETKTLTLAQREALAFNVENYIAASKINKTRFTRKAGISYATLLYYVLKPAKSWNVNERILDSVAKAVGVGVEDLLEPIGPLMDEADRVRNNTSATHVPAVSVSPSEVKAAALSPAAKNEVTASPAPTANEVTIEAPFLDGDDALIPHAATRIINLELADQVNFTAPAKFLKSIRIDDEGVLHISLR